jgi:hypothetical protein
MNDNPRLPITEGIKYRSTVREIKISAVQRE